MTNSHQPPFLIIETGQPVPSMKRHRGFPHWIRVAAGLEADDAVVVNVQGGESLPDQHEGFAGILVTGSGAMVTDKEDWSEATADWLRDAIHAGVPTLGICYGHQLIAHALGGEVGYMPKRQMGTIEVLTNEEDADKDPLFAKAPNRFSAQVTHMQSVMRAPEGAVILAKSDADPHHAFRFGEHAWGLQFHPEFSGTMMRGYVEARKERLAEEGICHKELSRGVSATPHARKVLRRFVRHARQHHVK